MDRGLTIRTSDRRNMITPASQDDSIPLMAIFTEYCAARLGKHGESHVSHVLDDIFWTW